MFMQINCFGFAKTTITTNISFESKGRTQGGTPHTTFAINFDTIFRAPTLPTRMFADTRSIWDGCTQQLVDNLCNFEVASCVRTLKIGVRAPLTRSCRSFSLPFSSLSGNNKKKLAASGSPLIQENVEGHW